MADINNARCMESDAIMPDPKRERRSRRRFTTEYKLKVIAEADARARGGSVFMRLLPDDCNVYVVRVVSCRVDHGNSRRTIA